MTLDDIEKLLEEPSSPSQWELRKAVRDLLAIAKAAKKVRDNFYGKKDLLEMENLDRALSALESSPKVSE